MTAAEAFFTLGGNNHLSIGLGLLAWALPVAALCIKKHREGLTRGSLVCVLFSLFFQIQEIVRRVDLEDWAAIEDTISGVAFCAAGLIAVALALNLSVWMKKFENR